MRSKARLASEQLERGALITVRAHGVARSSDCAREIMEQFLFAPAQCPDTGCLDGPRLLFDWRVGQGSEAIACELIRS